MKTLFAIVFVLIAGMSTADAHPQEGKHCHPDQKGKTHCH